MSGFPFLYGATVNGRPLTSVASSALAALRNSTFTLHFADVTAGTIVDVVALIAAAGDVVEGAFVLVDAQGTGHAGIW
jgi:hypothetical protein